MGKSGLMYDVIVIGARCAGSPTAMLLARKGYRVLLVDKATFPSNTMSNHYLQQSAVAQLKRWGLLDKVVNSGCPPIQKATFDFFGSIVFTARALPLEGTAEGYCPRRTVLDKILVDAAVEAGVELQERFVVQELCRDGEQVTGIRGRLGDGRSVTEKARIVIGADGMNSFVARSCNALEYNTKPSITSYHYSYWSGVPVDGGELYFRDRRLIIAASTNDNLTCITVVLPIEEFRAFRSNVKENFWAALDLVPQLAKRLRAGKREEPFYGTGNLPNFFRKPYGDGWALVGDAGCHRDPTLAQGIKSAFLSSELLVNAIDQGLSGYRPLNEALADYERQRNEALIPLYELVCQRASSLKAKTLSPEEIQFLAALQGNQKEIDRFWGVEAGTVAVQDFFSPQAIQQIIESSNPSLITV
ncbi:NAD(P)/FAD-dependent oxidoreductase [Moorena sp. SIO4A1]|uniref:NAD(P)/FAD-dependent oxidoreductase n=1 Tax=Moorena sp. SIO4A1 TaxID=2607835 RepID=UPI0025E50661|nr:NAD(P)/FAD-dependent oxidoreductase [Moorena sp. SIO4A1]